MKKEKNTRKKCLTNFYQFRAISREFLKLYRWHLAKTWKSAKVALSIKIIIMHFLLNILYLGRFFYSISGLVSKSKSEVEKTGKGNGKRYIILYAS